MSASKNFGGRSILTVEPKALTVMTRAAFAQISHLLRPAHLAQLSSILSDPEASDNDRFVALDLLKNANIAAGMILPMCQDTGTATIIGKKGQQVWTWRQRRGGRLLRVWPRPIPSSTCAIPRFRPRTCSTRSTPATTCRRRFDLYAEEGDEYHFLFIAKGGGSANKSFLHQQTKALLNPESLAKFLDAQIRTLGTAACPPYHLASGDRRHVGRDGLEDGEAGLDPLSRQPAHRRRQAWPCLPRSRMGKRSCSN